MKKNTSQIQVRIDVETKEKVKKVLGNIGLDLSSAVKILCKQIINTGTLPIDLSDVNGFRPQKAQELKLSIEDAKTSKGYTSTKKMLTDLLS